MGVILLPKKRNSQPLEPVEIDWSNPLTNGLRCAINSALPLRNLVHNSPVTIGREAERTGTQAGLAFNNTIGDGGGFFTDTIAGGKIEGSNEFSVLAFIDTRKIGGSDTDSNRVLAGYGGDLATYVWGYTVGLRADNYSAQQSMSLTVRNGYGTGSSVSSGTTIQVGAHVYVGTFKRAAEIRLYRDGASIASAAAGDHTVNTGGIDPNTFSIGLSKTSVTMGNTSPLLALFWSRELSPGEVKALSENPWQIFKPQQSLIYFTAAGGPTTYNESRSEALSLAETQSGLATFASSHSEPLPLADSSAGLAVFTLPHSEVLSLDATQASLMVSPVSVSEALALAETESSLAVFGNSHSEALSLAESAASLGVFPASQADALALAETEASTAVFAGSASETLALAESQDGNVLGGPSTYNESVSEPLSLAESPASLGIFPAELTENAALSEAVAASGAFPASQTDALSLAESWAGITAMAVSVSEALALVDDSSSQGALVASLAEALALAETQSIPALALSLTQADIDAIVDAIYLRVAAGASLLTVTQDAKLMSLPSAATTAAAVAAAAVTTPIYADIRKVNNVPVGGTGVEGDTWGPA